MGSNTSQSKIVGISNKLISLFMMLQRKLEIQIGVGVEIRTIYIEEWEKIVIGKTIDHPIQALDWGR